MGFIEMKCKSCGATLSVDASREFGYCSFCGAKYINQKEQNNIITNNYVNNTNNIEQAVIQHGDSVETLVSRFLAFCKINDTKNANSTVETMLKKFPGEAVSYYCAAITWLKYYIGYVEEFISNNNRYQPVISAKTRLKNIRRSYGLNLKEYFKYYFADIEKFVRDKDYYDPEKKYVNSINLPAENWKMHIENAKKFLKDSDRKQYENIIKEVECLSVKAEQLKLKFNTIVETDRKYLREAYEKQILGMSKCLRKKDFFWAFIGLLPLAVIVGWMVFLLIFY